MFDPIGMLSVLRKNDVRFIVVGGYAAGVLGAPIMTNDLDVCYDRDVDNLVRLATALRELGAKLRVARVTEELPFLVDAKTLAAGDSFTFQTDRGDLDILGTPSGTSGFRDLDAAASAYDLGNGLVVRVCSLDDLIRMKEAAHRRKDQFHLEELTALAERIQENHR